MKTLLIKLTGLFLLSSFACSNLQTTNGKDRTLIIFFNSAENYPGQITEREFWESPKNLDTVIVFGDRLNQLLDKRLATFKDTLINTGGLDEFFHKVAFIRIRNAKKDTIYASPLFKYWKKGNRNYIDTTGFFQQHFGNFSL
jgi:hypothetical protein